MLKPTPRTLLMLTALLAVGCAGPRKTEVLEARLRSQEDMIAVYESEIERFKTELASARSESEDLRTKLADGSNAVPAEESGTAFRASGIQLSSLMTGGIDIDGEPGHDALSVVLIPHDPDGELVKLPGSIEIEALDPSGPDGSERIGHWTFDRKEIHDYWHKGVVQSGYQFELPWQTPPRTDQVLVVAHLSTANGRKFDTTLAVKVDPPGLPADPSADGVQQASARDRGNPFDIQQAAAEQPADVPGEEEIIWAEGEGPAVDESVWARKAHQNVPAADDDPPFEPVPSSEQRAPRPSPPGATEATSPVTTEEPPDRSQPGEVPPPIEDWWSDDDWATEQANEQTRGTRTSDSFTDQTLPLYR